MPRDCRPFDALNPGNRETWKVYLRDAMMDWAVKRGPGAVKELGYTVRESVLKPTAIFRGDRDEGEPDWLCYVCRPPRAYDIPTGNSRTAWPGQVFLVKFDEYRILQWSGWMKADPDDPDLPENHDSFEERLL
jgi:hypothetical protein